METTQRSSQSFCARPGCGIAQTLHGHSATACSRFVAPGTKEANAMKRAHLSVVPDETEEETVETPTLSDAELLDEWKARALALGVLA